jgi:hypothetical protein
MKRKEFGVNIIIAVERWNIVCIEGKSRVAIFVRYINLLVNRLQGYLAQRVMGGEVRTSSLQVSSAP